MTEDKNLEQNLDKSNEKLHIFRNSIQERIKRHKDNISSCLELIQTKGWVYV